MKYEKPVARDLSSLAAAEGQGRGCTSGAFVPNQCVANGFSNATACVGAGIGVGSPPASCSTPGNLALDCTSGYGAGA